MELQVLGNISLRHPESWLFLTGCWRNLRNKEDIKFWSSRKWPWYLIFWRTFVTSGRMSIAESMVPLTWLREMSKLKSSWGKTVVNLFSYFRQEPVVWVSILPAQIQSSSMIATGILKWISKPWTEPTESAKRVQSTFIDWLLKTLLKRKLLKGKP